MDRDQKKRYEQLMEKNKDFVREKNWKSNILLQECLTALGATKKILSPEKQKEILSGFNKKIVSLQNAERREFDSMEEIIPGWSEKIYLIWDEAGLPVIETDLANIKGKEDDVKAVAFETWIVSESITKFLQFNRNGKITEFLIEHG